MGFEKGLAAILVGHVIGCLMLFLAGVIGGKSRLSVMETVKSSFGSRGGLLFLLTLILCKVIFFDGNVMTASADDSMSFGAAVELAVAMPLSWLPLISDYTREAKEPVKATAVSTIVYGLVSCWMYVIGMLGAILFPMDDITDFLYLIGSVFAPMIAIQIADFFILHRDKRDDSFDGRNLAIWMVGFILYRALMHIDLPVGNTLPDMAVTSALCVIVGKRWRVRN